MRNRPSYPEVYLRMALIFAERSHDGETRHACILTDPEYRIISCGTNGNPRGCDDDLLPDKRPTNEEEAKDPLKNKYFWKIHSEQNAIYNCAIKPPHGSKAFVTGTCCNNCAFALWQFGITDIYMLDAHGTHLFDEVQKDIFNIFVEQTGIRIHKIKLDEIY